MNQNFWSSPWVGIAWIFKILLSFSVVKATRPPAPDEYLISPITHERIPASKVQEHMRIGLLDPRWVEQRDKHIQDKMNQETVYAPGMCARLSFGRWTYIFEWSDG